jgi:hypothetical protein
VTCVEALEFMYQDSSGATLGWTIRAWGCGCYEDRWNGWSWYWDWYGWVLGGGRGGKSL